MFYLLEGEGALKHKYHLKGIGGRPSKQMKELQKNPLSFLLGNAGFCDNCKRIFNAIIDKECPRCKPNQNLINPSKSS